MIPEAEVEEVRRRTSLRVLVESVTKLHRKGGQWVGLCPFHLEKTPSFTVYEDQKRYHCFGCGEDGDVFAFIMKTQSLSFPDAVYVLAAAAGVSLSVIGSVPCPDLAKFAADRRLSRATLDRFHVRAVVHQERPALQYSTIVGIDRIKFTDGVRPKYTWVKRGGRAHWYGLDGAIVFLSAGAWRVYIVNGEPSVWACWEAGVPAICLAGGEGTPPTAALIEELAARLGALERPVEIAVVYDADPRGAQGSRAFVAALKPTWPQTFALDLFSALPEVPKADVDDLHRRVGDAGLAAALADLPLLGVFESPAEATSSDSTQPWLRLADVELEAVEWLWPGRIPLGKVTLLEGDPDEGKSCVAIDLAARVTRGLAMPNTCDLARDPAGVVFVTAEDGLADTIRPRLDAAEGDPECVLVFPLAALPQIDEAGLQTIENAMRACGARFLVWDPLNAFLSERVDTYKDHHIRRALAPLAALAARTGAAVLVIRHLNKSGGQNAKYRGGGSIGIFGAARSALLAAPDPDDPSRKVLALNKHNLCGDVPALGYELVQVDLPAAGDKPITTVRVRWLGPTRYTPQDLLAEQGGEEDRSALDEAMEAIRTIVAKGPVPVKDARATLRAAGVSDRTADRARTRLRVRARPTGYQGAWEWHPPALLPLGHLLEALANAIAAWVAAPRSSLWRDGETGGTGETDPQEPLVRSQSRQAAQSRQGVTVDEAGETGDPPVPDEEWLL